MSRWLADENFNHDIVRGLRGRNRRIDIVSVQDTGLTGIDDELLLACAAEQDRVLLTHDVSTIADFAHRRIMRGDRMPGVFELSRSVSIGSAVEDILLLDDCSAAGEWEGQVRYLPLR